MSGGTGWKLNSICRIVEQMQTLKSVSLSSCDKCICQGQCLGVWRCLAASAVGSSTAYVVNVTVGQMHM